MQPVPYPYIDDLSDEELYVLSTLGKGPKGDKGDKGDDGLFPTFADPIEWSVRTDYPANTVVLHDGFSYISKVAVPHGIRIDNTNYWTKYADPNAQVEQYRQEALAARGAADAAQTDINTLLPKSAFSSNDTIKKYIDDSVDVAKRRAIFIGNSYVHGAGATGGRGIFRRMEHLFHEAFEYWRDGTGFGVYPNHSTTFYDMIQSAASDTSFDNEEITDVFFVSAMGDTRAIAGGNESSVITNLEASANYVSENFPNATMYVVYAETIYGRNTQQAYSAKYWAFQYRTHYVFDSYKTRYGYVYLGWVGFNTNNRSGYNYTDNYHPNDMGYDSIVHGIMNSLRGVTPYQQYPHHFTLESNVQGRNFVIDLTPISPLCGIVSFYTQLTNTLFPDGITARTNTKITDLIDDDSINIPMLFFIGGDFSNADWRVVRMSATAHDFMCLDTLMDQSTGNVSLNAYFDKGYAYSDIPLQIWGSPRKISYAFTVDGSGNVIYQ